MNSQLNLLPVAELADKLSRLRRSMSENGLDSVLIADNANKYYLTGRVFSGYVLVGHDSAKWFVRRPSGFEGSDTVAIRKVENIADFINVAELGRVGFELGLMSYADITRFAKALNVTDFGNADKAIMSARAVKTEREVELIRGSSRALSAVYARIPGLFRPGMSDIELQIEIERESRLRGCLGLFRVSGQEMEINMGSVLVGDNADNASPYDFAMGGAGADPSLPVGADGTLIRPGNSVMVDTNGNFTGYMTDMTRTFVCGETSPEAPRAHQVSIDICQRLAGIGKPGVPAAELYNEAVRMANEAGLADRFMGHKSQAGFIGHGVGIVINEPPVLAPRSRDILAEGNVIAIEPKFVIEGVGAVGIENTYVVREDGLERLTDAPEDIVTLE